MRRGHQQCHNMYYCLVLCLHLFSQYRYQSTTGLEDVQACLLRRPVSNSIEHEWNRLVCNFLDFEWRGQVAINDVSCAECFEVILVFQGRRCDDGGESGQFSELYSLIIVSQLRAWEALVRDNPPYCPTELDPPSTTIGTPEYLPTANGSTGGSNPPPFGFWL